MYADELLFNKPKFTCKFLSWANCIVIEIIDDYRSLSIGSIYDPWVADKTILYGRP